MEKSLLRVGEEEYYQTRCTNNRSPQDLLDKSIREQKEELKLMNKGKSPLEYITQTFGRTWPEKISWGLWPHSAPILLRENPELPQQGKELHLTLSGVINFSDGWLCGTSILKDFNISVYTFTLKGFEAGDYGWDNYWKRPTTTFTEAFREYLETKREGILDSIFPRLLGHVGVA
jgi:hypothetical protein